MEDQVVQIKFDPDKKSSNANGVTNGEYFLRMQYLLQATEIVKDISLQRFYSGEMKNIAKRQVLRIDSDIKRRFCKRCNGMLEVPSQVQRHKEQKKRVQCQYCKYIKSVYPAKKEIVIKESE